MSARDLAVFAGLPEVWIEEAIWGATGYPCFWDLRRGEAPAHCFWRQIYRAARLAKRGWLGDYIDWAWNIERPKSPWRPPS